MTIQNVLNACLKNKYILLRFRDGTQFGVNTKIVNSAMKKNPKMEKESQFISFVPCSFHQYISNKQPFK